MMDKAKRYIDRDGYAWEYRHGIWGFRPNKRAHWCASENTETEIVDLFSPLDELTTADTVDGIEGNWV